MAMEGFFVMEEDGAGKGSGDQAVMGGGEKQRHGKQFPGPLKRAHGGRARGGFRVTHKREVRDCRLQVSLVDGPG